MLERTEAMDAGAVERAAEAGWREESLRAAGRDRRVPWSEVPGNERNKWIGLANAMLAALTPSPSVPAQAGEAPCRHEWYLGQCCHCEMKASEFRASPSVHAHVPVKVEALAKRLESIREKLIHLAPDYSKTCNEAASALRTLSAERDEARHLAYDLKYAAAGGEDVPLAAHAVTVKDVNRWCEEAEARATAAEADRDRLTADLGEAVKALERKLHAAFMEGRESTFGTDRHRADRAWENSRALASLRARSEASHGG